MTLLPGVVLIALAVAGLVFSAWRVWQRVALAAGVLVSLALAAGTSFGGDGDPGYLTLMRHLPGWDALRTPGRLVLWTTLLLGVLAAGALTVRESPPAGAGRRDWRRWGRVALVLPALLVLAEGVNRTPHVPVPAQPVALRGVAGPVLVLPLGGIRDYHVMLWSTTASRPRSTGWPRSLRTVSSGSARPARVSRTPGRWRTCGRPACARWCCCRGTRPARRGRARRPVRSRGWGSTASGSATRWSTTSTGRADWERFHRGRRSG
ncbi:hypothetical protein JNW89_08655 [Micromonospora sp. 4G55]|nr:hypothetical protein [Micromonospora sp. 4G55]